jgi:hypothetical protein
MERATTGQFFSAVEAFLEDRMIVDNKVEGSPAH